MVARARPKRAYVQGRRAEATAATAARILAAAQALFLESGEEPTLDAVAERAGVTVQTILRRHGSKEGLFEACIAAGAEEVGRERETAPPGDVGGAIDALVAHYDAWGERSLRLLWLEPRSAAAARVVAGGRAYHRAWVERAFGPLLAALPGAVRARRLAQLAAVTDVYAWKVLTKDQGLDRDETRRAIRELVEALLAHPAPTPATRGAR